MADVRRHLGVEVRIPAELPALALAMSMLPAMAQAQDLGHKIPGAIGLDAGKAPVPGLYLGGRFVHYRADRLIDRDGARLPVEGFDLDAFAQALGVTGTLEVPALGAGLSVTVAVPLAKLTVGTDRPEASVDRFGLGDVYLQPVKLGWRLAQVDVVTSYAIYLPTDQFVLGSDGGGVSRGHVTHELAAGGALFLGPSRTAYVSGLASYELNMQKREIDITRGDTFQVQGGAGVTLLDGAIDLGVAGYALWQVRDDRGSELPPALRGARDRVFGLGPEIAVSVPAIRSRFTVRYLRDFGVESRPDGQLVLAGITAAVSRPDEPRRARN